MHICFKKTPTTEEPTENCLVNQGTAREVRPKHVG